MNVTYQVTRRRPRNEGHCEMLKNQEDSFMRARLAAVGTVIAAGIVLLLSPAPMRAHHAFAAEFDANKPVHFPDAVVTKVMVITPHNSIYVDVRQADGTVENWAIEAGSPNVLLRRGITRNTLKAGDKIVVDGYQSKDGSHRANG